MERIKSVIITGGLGYIGSSIALKFIKEGWHVTAIDDLSRSTISDLQIFDEFPVKSFNFIESKIQYLSGESMRRLKCRTYDAMIHCAALKDVEESVSKPFEYYTENLTSQIEAMRVAEELNIPSFILSSSASIYGDLPNSKISEFDLNENGRNPHIHLDCPYAATKLLGENLLDVHRVVTSMRMISLRYFNPIGTMGKLDKSGSLMSVLMDTMKTREITINGDDWNTEDGSCIRDFIDIRDLADAHFKVTEFLKYDENFVGHEVFNVGTGITTTVKQIIREFADQSPWDFSVITGPRRSGDAQGGVADVSKIKSQLGWESQYTIKDSIQNLLSTFKK